MTEDYLNGKLLSCKELAYELGYHYRYVYAMRAAGFLMPGKRATVAAALAWLETYEQINGRPFSKRSRKTSGTKRDHLRPSE
jgi:hypothetical protein